MPLQRSSAHWREYEFDHFLTAVARKPFAWGSHDCCLFAADAIKSFATISTPETTAAYKANTAAHKTADAIRNAAERRAAHAKVASGFTGVDLAAAFRGQYDDQRSAFAAIRKITGGSTVADAAAWCANQHGLEELKHPLCAQRGDLVVMRQNASDPESQWIAGVVHLSGAHLVSVAETGAVRLPITSVVRAWRV